MERFVFVHYETIQAVLVIGISVLAGYIASFLLPKLFPQAKRVDFVVQTLLLILTFAFVGYYWNTGNIAAQDIHLAPWVFAITSTLSFMLFVSRYTTRIGNSIVRNLAWAVSFAITFALALVFYYVLFLGVVDILSKAE
jgi:hypothetical protein